MSVSTANATDGVSNLTASATIIEPTIIECTPIDFGTLYFRASSGSDYSNLGMDSNGKISQSSNSPKYGLLFDGQGTPGTCTGLPEGATFSLTNYSGTIYLNEAKTIYVGGIKYAYGKLTGTLYINPDAVLDGSELTGSAVMQFTYE